MSLEVSLNRADRVYRPGDMVSGVIRVKTKGGMSHNGVSINLSGRVTFIMSAKSVGMIESIYNSLKPITLADYTTQVCKSGKLGLTPLLIDLNLEIPCTPDGVTELPFEFRLEPLSGQQLQETYHGIYVNTQYLLTADLTGSLLGRNLQEVLLFFVECPNSQKLIPNPESFSITPDGIEVTTKKSTRPIPKFKLSGKIDSKTCSITQPFTGHIVVEECEVPIRSIELQLRRVETVGSMEGYSKESTEIQNIQIGDGDVPRNFEIDIHMIFPRLFSCRSVQERSYKVEFEVDLVILFEDGRNITEKFPITLVREWGA